MHDSSTYQIIIAFDVHLWRMQGLNLDSENRYFILIDQKWLIKPTVASLWGWRIDSRCRKVISKDSLEEWKEFTIFWKIASSASFCWNVKNSCLIMINVGPVQVTDSSLEVIVSLTLRRTALEWLWRLNRILMVHLGALLMLLIKICTVFLDIGIFWRKYGALDGFCRRVI